MAVAWLDEWSFAEKVLDRVQDGSLIVMLAIVVLGWALTKIAPAMYETKSKERVKLKKLERQIEEQRNQRVRMMNRARWQPYLQAHLSRPELAQHLSPTERRKEETP